jgi:hypothetical protein
MSRSRKKRHIYKDSGSTPEIRRLTRSRMKTPRHTGTKYNTVVNTWSFNDHVIRECDMKRYIRAISEKYQNERQRVLNNRHPLCLRYGKAGALKKLEQREKRELFEFTKRFHTK